MSEIHPLTAFRANQTPPLSQAGLAALLEVGVPAVHRWEAGVRKIGVDVLPRVAKQTGIPASVLRPDLAELFAEVRP